MHTCPLAYEEGKETGGMNVYVMQLSQALSKVGYTIDIYTRLQSKKLPRIVVINNHLRVIHIEDGPEHTPKKQLIDHVSTFAKNVTAYMEKEKLSYNLIHAHYYLSALAGIEIKKQHNMPLLVNFHTLAIMKNLVARSELEREETRRIEAEIYVSQEADHIIAPSETDKEYLFYLYNIAKEKITVIHPGVDTTLFRPLEKDTARAYIHAEKDHKIILFVGRIEPLKGIDSLLYAVKILLKKHAQANICLLIVGGDITQKPKEWSKELQKLEELRRVLNITSAVTFVGQKSQTELPYYYNASDVVVMPSHYESFGMSALEAIACGTPVITTNVTGIATLIDKQYRKFVVPANSPLLLASQIETTLFDNNQEEVRRQLVEHMQNFQWNTVVKKMTAVYTKLIPSYGK